MALDPLDSKSSKVPENKSYQKLTENNFDKVNLSEDIGSMDFIPTGYKI